MARSAYTRKRSAQVFTADYIIGLTMFLLLLVLAIRLMTGAFPSQQYRTLYEEAVIISDTLLDEGYPADWNSSNVVLPGIAKNNRINDTKLQRFDNMSYSSLKSRMHVASDFVFFFQNSSGIIDYFGCTHGYSLGGSCSSDPSSVEYDNLVKIERLVILNSSISQMVIYAWN